MCVCMWCVCVHIMGAHIKCIRVCNTSVSHSEALFASYCILRCDLYSCPLPPLSNCTVHFKHLCCGQLYTRHTQSLAHNVGTCFAEPVSLAPGFPDLCPTSLSDSLKMKY